MFIWTRPFQGHERSVRQSSDKARSAVATRSSPSIRRSAVSSRLFFGAGAGTRDTVQGTADREDTKSFPERRPKSTGVENGLRGARKAPKPPPDLYLMAGCLSRHLNHSGHIGEPGLEQDGEGPKNPEAILPAHTGRGVGRGGAPKTKAITGPQRWDDVDAPDPVFLDQVEDPLKEPRHAKGKEGRRVQKRTDRPATVLQLTADGPCPFPKEQRIEEETQGPRDGEGGPNRKHPFLRKHRWHRACWQRGRQHQSRRPVRGPPQAAVPRRTGAEGEGREAFEGRAHSTAQAQTKKRKRKSRAA